MVSSGGLEAQRRGPARRYLATTASPNPLGIRMSVKRTSSSFACSLSFCSASSPLVAMQDTCAVPGCSRGVAGVYRVPAPGTGGGAVARSPMAPLTFAPRDRIIWIAPWRMTLTSSTTMTFRSLICGWVADYNSIVVKCVTRSFHALRASERGGVRRTLESRGWSVIPPVPRIPRIPRIPPIPCIPWHPVASGSSPQNLLSSPQNFTK